MSKKKLITVEVPDSLIDDKAKETIQRLEKQVKKLETKVNKLEHQKKAAQEVIRVNENFKESIKGFLATHAYEFDMEYYDY